jgi:signal peptidase I
MRGIRIVPVLLFALFASCLLLFFAFSFLVVDGPSMRPSFRDGQMVMVDRLAFGIRSPAGYLLRWSRPRRGQLLVFRNPQDGRLVFKRCIGEAGAGLVPVSGGLSVGGAVIPLDPSQAFHFMDSGTVPPGCVFVSGDNPPESVDSRDYGCVPIEKIIGIVVLSF